MLVEENGKVYEIDPATKTVVEAGVKQEEETVATQELRVNDRVEAEGRLGKIYSRTPSVYGSVLAVRFDDGTYGEYVDGDVKLSTEEEVDKSTPVSEVTSRYEVYKQMPGYTIEELASKAAEARWLNLRAKSLVTDSKLAFSDQSLLDTIVVTTGADIMDIREDVQRLEASDRQRELAGTEYRMEMGHGAGAPVMGVRDSGGTDWLDEILDTELTELTDADLATRATEVVAMFSREQLASDSFMDEAESFQMTYLGHTTTDEPTRDKFKKYLGDARTERLVQPEPVAKEASVEDLDDFDTSALFN